MRYLDRSPRSYEARRDIRKGMVDLLRGIHARRRYDRVVVAHSLGAFIAYDAIAWLWSETCALHSGPLRDDGTAEPLTGLTELEKAAKKVDAHPDAIEALEGSQQRELASFRDAQFELWRNLRLQGNPWLVTDLITIGTPMYFRRAAVHQESRRVRPPGEKR